jgi:hypothetical protein
VIASIGLARVFRILECVVVDSLTPIYRTGGIGPYH